MSPALAAAQQADLQASVGGNVGTIGVGGATGLLPGGGWYMLFINCFFFNTPWINKCLLHMLRIHQNFLLVAKTNTRLTVKIIGCQRGIYLFKMNNRDTKTMCEICSKLRIKTPERCQSVVMVSLLLTLNISLTLLCYFDC